MYGTVDLKNSNWCLKEGLPYNGQDGLPGIRCAPFASQDVQRKKTFVCAFAFVVRSALRLLPFALKTDIVAITVIVIVRWHNGNFMVFHANTTDWSFCRHGMPYAIYLRNSLNNLTQLLTR